MQWRHVVIILASAALVSGCATTVSKPSGNTDNLYNLQNLSAPPPRVDQAASHALSDMRKEALKEVAITVGAQSGLHWRSQQINALLMHKSKVLDTAYNFNGLLLDHNILPPVLTEAQQTLKLDGPNTIRLSDKVYEIISQAKFVTTAPTWRDYLWMDYPQPPVPNAGILPHTAQERTWWREYAKEGWARGVEQANAIYSENLSRLERDYKGMILYHQLRLQNIVSAPFVAATPLGITGGGEKLNINDQVLRITALPALQPNSQRWKAAVIMGEP